MENGFGADNGAESDESGANSHEHAQLNGADALRRMGVQDLDQLVGRALEQRDQEARLEEAGKAAAEAMRERTAEITEVQASLADCGAGEGARERERENDELRHAAKAGQLELARLQLRYQQRARAAAELERALGHALETLRIIKGSDDDVFRQTRELSAGEKAELVAAKLGAVNTLISAGENGTAAESR